jgi:hypothetical protein
MKDETIEDQNELIELIEDAGWNISAVELTQYGAPWRGRDVTGAEIELEVHKDYRDEEDDQNPYRVK